METVEDKGITVQYLLYYSVVNIRTTCERGMKAQTGSSGRRLQWSAKVGEGESS